MSAQKSCPTTTLKLVPKFQKYILRKISKTEKFKNQKNLKIRIMQKKEKNYEKIIRKITKLIQQGKNGKKR